MGVPTSEVGYTSATTGRGDHEVHTGHVAALERERERETKVQVRFLYGIQQVIAMWSSDHICWLFNSLFSGLMTHRLISIIILAEK
jgi:hypothetical protein